MEQNFKKQSMDLIQDLTCQLFVITGAYRGMHIDQLSKLLSEFGL
jgi:hypothetical protein